ncbi:MAG TPA: hypothetical protein VE262_05205 [Blastocatellia bacterium]|nr:hypothetical protein [Blastocatellia bacterium]
MKTLSIQKTILSLALAITLFGAAIAAARQAPASASQKTGREHSVTRHNEEWTWRQTDNGVGIEMKMRGKVQFNDDYTDILTLSDDGWFRIIDDRKGPERRLEITRNAGGEITRSYRVSGEARPYDQEASRWLASVLNDAVRQAGFDAKNRVQKILAKSGAGGVLEEISLLKSDHVKGVYFRELLKSTALDPASVRRSLREVASQMSSDYEKAQVLMVLAESYLNDDSTRTAYLNAVGTIGSDYERGRVLSALLKKSDLNDDILTHAIRTAASISSDYEKAKLLINVAGGKMRNPAVRRVYLETAGTIGSNYEKARVLSELVKRNDLDRDAILLVVKSAVGISSDYEKARVLIQVARAHAGDESIRAALTDAAKTIGSEYERGRVLSVTHR